MFSFQIFTYVVIALGFVLFFSGLLGWVGGFSESVCLVRLFYLSLILSIVAEIGGLIALAIINVSLPQVVGIGWQEVNQGTRNIVQRNVTIIIIKNLFKKKKYGTCIFSLIQLNCCGWLGPKDFAYTNDPIDESCYETVVRSNSGIWPRGSSHSNGGGGITFEDEDALSSRLKVVDGPTVPTKKMKEDGCGELLVGWFRSNKLIWATILASLIALQLMATGIAMYILSRVKKLRKLR